MLSLRSSLGILLVTASAACAGTMRPHPAPASPLLGRWVGADSTTFVFRPDSTALWIFARGAAADTFAIRYRADASVTPWQLELLGFDRGPLAGRTLYCIGEPAGGDAFRMDCEPGASAAARPGAFTAQTRTYQRRP